MSLTVQLGSKQKSGSYHTLAAASEAFGFGSGLGPYAGGADVDNILLPKFSQKMNICQTACSLILVVLQLIFISYALNHYSKYVESRILTDMSLAYGNVVNTTRVMVTLMSNQHESGLGAWPIILLTAALPALCMMMAALLDRRNQTNDTVINVMLYSLFWSIQGQNRW